MLMCAGVSVCECACIHVCTYNSLRRHNVALCKLIIINITFFLNFFFNNHETGIVLTKRFQFKFGNFQKVLA